MRRACRSKGLVAVLRKGACRTWRGVQSGAGFARGMSVPGGDSSVMQARYLAGLYDLEELGSQMRRQAGQVGMNDAQQWIALTDGGNVAAKTSCVVNFPRDVVLILDFWHAGEYLSDLTACHPDDEESRNDLLTSWCQTMKQKGGQGIVAVLDTLLLPPQNTERASPIRNHTQLYSEQFAPNGLPNLCGKWLVHRFRLSGVCLQDGGQP